MCIAHAPSLATLPEILALFQLAQSFWYSAITVGWLDYRGWGNMHWYLLFVTAEKDQPSEEIQSGAFNGWLSPLWWNHHQSRHAHQAPLLQQPQIPLERWLQPLEWMSPCHFFQYAQTTTHFGQVHCCITLESHLVYQLHTIQTLPTIRGWFVWCVLLPPPMPIILLQVALCPRARNHYDERAGHQSNCE